MANEDRTKVNSQDCQWLGISLKGSGKREVRCAWGDRAGVGWIRGEIWPEFTSFESVMEWE